MNTLTAPTRTRTRAVELPNWALDAAPDKLLIEVGAEQRDGIRMYSKPGTVHPADCGAVAEPGHTLPEARFSVMHLCHEGACGDALTGAERSNLAEMLRAVTALHQATAVGKSHNFPDALVVTVRNLPAQYALKRIHEGHLFADPAYWAHEDRTARALDEPTAAWISAAFKRTLDEHIPPGMRPTHPDAETELVDYLNRRGLDAQPGPTSPGHGTRWLFHARRFYGSSLQQRRWPDNETIHNWNDEMLTCEQYARLLRTRHGHQLDDVNVALIHEHDADLFPRALVIDAQPDDEPRTLQQIWNLASSVVRAPEARNLADAYRASGL